jgi:hypothetical protein
MLHEYQGIELYADRSAQIVLDDNGDYGVIYILKDSFNEHRVFPDHSLHYAEDAAENWVTGVIKPNDILAIY